MTQSAPKRYAHAIIRHFIIISLFFPTFYSKFSNVHYQDFFFANVLALMFAVNILHKWKLDIRRHLFTVVPIGVLLLMYNLINIYNYTCYGDERYFWKSDQVNVTIAFLFFLTLLLVKDDKKIVSDQVIKLTIGAVIVNNLIACCFRMAGYSKFYMKDFYYKLEPISRINNQFCWLYEEASEYALILLLCMALFLVYQKHFPNRLLCYFGHGVLLIGMLLTKSGTYYLATAILYGGTLLEYLLRKYKVPKEILKPTYLFTAAFTVLGSILLFTKVESFHTKYLIWKGNWEILMSDHLGLGTNFGPTAYEVPFVGMPINQAHNVFLNHMLRHSLWVGIAFTLIFVVIFVNALLRKPNYRTLGFLLAILLPLNMDYSLQTLHLPFVLFLLYCIFFRPEKELKEGEEI